MNKITIATTYYNCPQLAQQFVEENLALVDEMIIVDDGSDEDYKIQNILTPSKKLRLFRVPQDLGFNSHGCRNLAATQSTNNWMVMVDIDRKFLDTNYTFNSIKSKSNLFVDSRYRFVMHTGEIGRHMHYTVNDFLIHKDHFFSVGGYDEELVSQRTGDREFFKQLVNAGGKELVLHDIDIVMKRLSSASQPAKIKQSIMSSNDSKTVNVETRKIVESRIKAPVKYKPILQFDWYEIT